VVRQLSEEFIERSSGKLRSVLVECLIDIEGRFGASPQVTEQFRKFVQQATKTRFAEQFLRARTTSMLFETLDLLLEPRSVDPEVLMVKASFEAVVKRVRNEIVHRPSIYDPHLLSEHDEVVVETRAIDGLALLASRLLDYRPQL